MIPESRRFIAGKVKPTHARTGAKDGPSAPLKVQTTTKPEENIEQDRKGTTSY